MTIEVVLGCMFSGKSTELIRRISTFQSINKPVLCVNHSIDTRWEELHSSHLLANSETKSLNFDTRAEANKVLDPLGSKTDDIGSLWGTNIIRTHEGRSIPAIKTDTLMTIITNDLYTQAEVIGIDEAQFFNDLVEFVLYTEKQKKSLIICGLDGDYKRQPIGQILNCIPLADSVIKLKALDMIDKDGTPAIFTKRKDTVKSQEQILVGGKDEYLAVSRKNYHN